MKVWRADYKVKEKETVVDIFVYVVAESIETALVEINGRFVGPLKKSLGAENVTLWSIRIDDEVDK